MFKKRTYSDLEVQEIMETLFLEKKKVKELQVKLSHSLVNSNIPASSEELAKHKAEIQILLVRLEEGKLREQQSEARRLHAESEMRQLKNGFETSLEQHAKLKTDYHSLIEQFEKKKQQSEKDIQHLNEQLENYQNYIPIGESSKLKADYQFLLEQSEKKQQQAEEEIRQLKEKLYVQHQDNSNQDKQKEAQLERVVQFMRARLEEIQIENQHLVQKLEGFGAKEKEILDELEQAKQASTKLLLEKEESKEEEQALKAQMEQLHSEIFKMQSLVENEKQNQEALINAQKEIELLKQMMLKTLQENKEERLKEESLYQDQIAILKVELDKEKGEMETLNSTLKDHSQLVEELKANLEALTASNNELCEEVEQQKRAYHELAQFSEEMKSKIVKSEEEKVTALSTLMKKEELIHNLSSQVANLSRSNERMEDLTRQGEIDKQEIEARLRAAQQHLAKKMREMALLTEQYEELKLRHEDLEKSMDSLKSKLIEMKAQLDAEAQQKQHIQKQYQEGLKSIETQAAKWEEKYFQIHEKLQDTESRNRELKRLEERFGKVQHLFGNLGNLLGSPMSIETSEAVDTPVAKKFAEEHGVQTTLFEAVPPPRYKESLFG